MSLPLQTIRPRKVGKLILNSVVANEKDLSPLSSKLSERSPSIGKNSKNMNNSSLSARRIMIYSLPNGIKQGKIPKSVMPFQTFTQT